MLTSLNCQHNHIFCINPTHHASLIRGWHLFLYAIWRSAQPDLHIILYLYMYFCSLSCNLLTLISTLSFFQILGTYVTRFWKTYFSFSLLNVPRWIPHSVKYTGFIHFHAYVPKFIQTSLKTTYSGNKYLKNGHSTRSVHCNLGTF